MDIETALVLTDALKQYYDNELEFQCFSELYDVSTEEYGPNDVGVDSARIDYSRMARKLTLESELGNNRRFLDALIPSLIIRCKKYIAETTYEKRSYHEAMLSRLDVLQSLVGSPRLREEITVPDDHPFLAKSEVREFLKEALTEIIIVDTYIGIGTLDCLREVTQHIRVLTSEKNGSIERGFDSAFRDFLNEDKDVEIRQHHKLHDRFIIFNERCWLVGSSIKDAGKKTFNMIECVDIKSAIIKEVEQKWSEGKGYANQSL